MEALRSAQNNDGQLTLTVGSQPTYKLRPYQSRTFVIDQLEGFRVEFHLGPDGGKCMNCSSTSRMDRSWLGEPWGGVATGHLAWSPARRSNAG